MSFGENLKKARLAAGLTQTELAKRTGVTERSIYNYEKNSRRLTWQSGLRRF